MEGTNNGKNLVVMIIVIGMVAGQITGSFESCYGECFLLCVVLPNNSNLPCALKCLKDCIIPFSPSDLHYYCNLGCASSLCTNISTQQNPGGEEVKGCVGSCSETCTKYH